jgi:hypothetical protein
MQPLDLLLTSLASFYVAYAVSSTHGPFHAFAWLRANVSIGGLLECLVCLSPWAALLFLWLLTTPYSWIAWLFAAAGASVLLWRYTGGSSI